MMILNLPDIPDILDYPELKKRLIKLITYIVDDDIDLTPIERFTYAFCNELMGVQHDR